VVSPIWIQSQKPPSSCAVLVPIQNDLINRRSEDRRGRSNVLQLKEVQVVLFLEHLPGMLERLRPSLESCTRRLLTHLVENASSVHLVLSGLVGRRSFVFKRLQRVLIFTMQNRRQSLQMSEGDLDPNIFLRHHVRRLLLRADIGRALLSMLWMLFPPVRGLLPEALTDLRSFSVLSSKFSRMLQP